MGGCRGFGEGLKAARMWRGAAWRQAQHFLAKGSGTDEVALGSAWDPEGLGPVSHHPGWRRRPQQPGQRGSPRADPGRAQAASAPCAPLGPGSRGALIAGGDQREQPRAPPAVVGNSAGLGGASRKRAPQRGTARWARPAAGPRDPGPRAMRSAGGRSAHQCPTRPASGGAQGTPGDPRGSLGRCTAAGRTRLLSRYPRGHPGKEAPGQAGVGTGAHRALPSLGVLGAAG